MAVIQEVMVAAFRRCAVVVDRLEARVVVVVVRRPEVRTVGSHTVVLAVGRTHLKPVLESALVVAAVLLRMVGAQPCCRKMPLVVLAARQTCWR